MARQIGVMLSGCFPGEANAIEHRLHQGDDSPKSADGNDARADQPHFSDQIASAAATRSPDGCGPTVIRTGTATPTR